VPLFVASQTTTTRHRLAKPMTALVIVAIAAVQFHAKAIAQYPVIELAVIQPQFGQIGTSLDLRVSGGNHLDQIDRLFFSDPRITAEVITEVTADETAKDQQPQAQQPQPKWGHFKVTIPADIAAGRYEVCAAGAYGISNPRVFDVTSNPVVALDAASENISEPTVLDDQLASAGKLIVNHQATAARIHYFRLTRPAKQLLRVSIDAQRIDSRMIAQLSLIASDGQVLQAARGADGFDPRIRIPTGPSDGFTIAVHDFLYRGGENYFYGLRIESDDAPSNEAPTVVAASALLPKTDRLEAVTLPAIDDAQEIVKHTIEIDSAPINLTPPCIVEATAHSPPRDHIFHFDAEEAGQLSVEVASERLGQPTDMRLMIERREVKADAEDVWHAVTSADDPPAIGDAVVSLRSKDPVVLFTAPATATYRIKVRNLDTGSSLADEPIYRLALREPAPNFSLIAIPAHPHNDVAQSRPRGCRLTRGDTQSIRVLIARRDGFSSPVKLSVSNLPAGLTSRPVTVAADQSEAFLTVSASEEAPDWIGDLQVTGKSVGGDHERSSTATAATFIWGGGDQRDFVRSRLATRLMMSVAQEQQAPLSIGLGSEQAVEGKLGETISLPITLIRREGGGAPVVLRPRNLPPGVTAADVTIAADQTQGTMELKIAADAKPESYSLWLQGETKVKFKPITQAEPSDLTVFIPSTTADIELIATP
jgi:hypothetical protein